MFGQPGKFNDATPLPVALRAWTLLAVPATLWVGALLLLLAVIG